ncbi:hypothetical protein [Natrinema thermotolerans]|uniref:hypothetical protein n=1 Tax=Natrinema thermotolerans TaxID=121872 RepID=UPI00067905AE|nr:hypothetical protein [Natrinema thermotolerans]QCC57329.1 hypothetical protein DVR14_01220 [Natrinema thermotolerans]
MARRSYRANQVLSDAVSDRVDEFDSRVLEDWMHSVDDGDDLVHHYAEAIANAQHAAEETDERYGWQDDLHTTTDEAVQNLEAALKDHLDVLVAEICATVANREGDWIDHTDDENVEPAVHEARDWLQAHQEAAERAGVWDEVTA